MLGAFLNAPLGMEFAERESERYKNNIIIVLSVVLGEIRQILFSIRQLWKSSAGKTVRLRRWFHLSPWIPRPLTQLPNFPRAQHSLTLNSSDSLRRAARNNKPAPSSPLATQTNALGSTNNVEREIHPLACCEYDERQKRDFPFQGYHSHILRIQ